MNYQKIYDKLIESAKDRSYSSKIHEKHHVLPRALGGDDSETNLVILTHGEHYVAHKLLKRMYPKERSMCYALWLMIHTKNGKITSREYANLKEEYSSYISIQMKGRVLSEEHKAKLRKPKDISYLTPEHRAKLSKASKGRKKTEEWKQNNAIRSMKKIEVKDICFLSVKDACAYLNVTDVTISNWRKQGKHGAKYIN